MILFETPKTPCCSSARHIAGAFVPAQATKSRSGFATSLLREQGEVLRRQRDEQRLTLCPCADDLVDVAVVAVAEDRVLREDGHVLADAAQRRRRCLHILVGLATRAERVAVDPGHLVRGRGRR